MATLLSAQQLTELDPNIDNANALADKINAVYQQENAENTWHVITTKLLPAHTAFALSHYLFTQLFPTWQSKPETAPAWIPTDDFIQTTHIAHSMAELKVGNYAEFHAFSTTHVEKFWQHVLQKLQIVFQSPPEKICDLTDGVESPHWLVNAKLNIADSCFTAPPTKPALLFPDENGAIQSFTYAQLNRLSNQIANGLCTQGFLAGDAIAIDMPMTHFAVAIYLGIIKMGGVVVSIADSFSAEEIATRLKISQAKAIFTQDFILRNQKKIPLYEKVIAAHAPRTIILPAQQSVTVPLRFGDIDWDTFLSPNEHFQTQSCQPLAHCNILFSSGTTSDPKAIPWNHTTGIKAASDAYFHQDIHPEDILAWPTNLGWMMGPWLIFAGLINQATIALYDDAPRDRAFGQFIQDAKVTMLGVIPSLVGIWRQTHCMTGLNWDAIKVFSSTGECSNPEDMFYLMSLAGFKPVIEYCGGTEIGGAYVTSTLVEKNYPSLLSTPTLGSNFLLLDEMGQNSNKGEVALIAPALGLSTELLNADHHQVYFAGMPLPLRRHGDQLQRFANGYYCVLGRADDTMNLGGIKISSAEIERALAGLQDISETAAVAVTAKGQGPSCLVIYAVAKNQLDKAATKEIMQKKINQHLNPLFKIHDVVVVAELPKTASNKIMRRVLRDLFKG